MTHKNSLLRPAFVTFLALAFSVSSVSGYVGTTVSNGGAVSGTVTAPGAKALPPVRVAKDAQVCSATHQPETIVVGKDGALANAVVYLKDIATGKPLDKAAKASLDNKACTYVPHVAVVPVGSTLTIHSSDNVLHNVHALMGSDTLFNIALPLPGMQIPQTMRKPGIVNVKCDAGHTWMAATIYVVEHPYYAVTDAAGKFDLKDVPPGTYTLVAWHESLGTQEQKVTVATGKPATASFTYAAK
ncbi:MAG: carboxypeptidase regulatory-like domain-containing protein [Thermoanaerobaculia bacterium]